MSNKKVSDVLALSNTYGDKPSELTADDIQAIMKAHNDLRARYGVAPLQWDNDLANVAKQWSDACYWGHWRSQKTKNALGADYFEPPKQAERFGENLSAWEDFPSSMLDGQEGTKLWLDEEKDFDCSTGQCVPGKMCGHLTQMVWEDTKKVGCALRTCENGVDPRSWSSPIVGRPNMKYLVCQYDPPGNYIGERPFPAANCSQKSASGSGSGSAGATTLQPQTPVTVTPDTFVPPTNMTTRKPVIPASTPTAGNNSTSNNDYWRGVPNFFRGLGRDNKNHLPPPTNTNNGSMSSGSANGSGGQQDDVELNPNNFSKVPNFFQGLGRTNQTSMPYQRKAYVPPGMTFVQQQPSATTAQPTPSQQIESHIVAEDPQASTAKVVEMTRESPPNQTTNIAAASAGILLGGAALGALIGVSIFASKRSNKSRS